MGKLTAGQLLFSFHIGQCGFDRWCFRQLFFQACKVRGACLKQEGVEAQRCIIIAPQLCGLITEGKDFQIAKVVFQVGGGFRADVVVNGIRRCLLYTSRCV